jgi:hypothetical protein
VLDKLCQGKISCLGPAVGLMAWDGEPVECIVGMMAADPMIKALDTQAQVVLTGQSSDAAI